jgi:hypothetical protein
MGMEVLEVRAPHEPLDQKAPPTQKGAIVFGIGAFTIILFLQNANISIIDFACGKGLVFAIIWAIFICGKTCQLTPALQKWSRPASTRTRKHSS